MSSAPTLALSAPAAVVLHAPDLSADQRAVVGLAPGSGPALIWGAPGTGKSTVLVEAAVKRIEHDGVDPAGVLLLGPSRLAAARLRDALSARLNRSLSISPARTWASYAFDVLRRAKVEGRLPHVERAPRLLSGPEQDLIIKELLDGHRLGLGKAPAWPADLHDALGTRGFRQEVRQLFDRVIEYGLDPAELARLGVENARPDWVAAASLYGEYRDVVDWGKSGSFDPAGIITAVTTLFSQDPEYLALERERLQLILVDDIQEANQAVHDLLSLLGRGKDVLATASPDTVVQGFRGARPDLAGTVRDHLADPATGTTVGEFVLRTSHRMDPELAASWGAVAAKISQTRGGHKARQLVWEPAPSASTAAVGTDPGTVDDGSRPGGPAAGLVPEQAEPDMASVPEGGTTADGSEPAGPVHPHPPKEPTVTVHLVASEVHELRLVAERILDLQHWQGYELGQIAVIVRTGGHLAALQRYLSGQGIPVKVPVAENPVRDEAAVRPLLDAFKVSLDPSLLDAEMAVSLLTSRLGRSTTIHLRRLRQALRRAELGSGGGRESDSLLVDALLDPANLAHLGWEASNAARLAAMLAAGRTAVAEPGANAETVLWALWSTADCSDTWAAQAIKGGPAGIRADRDLDAIMALFQTAERYVDQLPGSSPQQFLEYLLSQDLPMDTLAARAQRSDAVEILTPASAAGREWPVVIVAGLQEGVWPNTRLRGELLGSQLLVDVAERGAAAARQVDAAARLREIRYDELRSFAAAISRATERLICTAASSHELQPSQFLDLVSPWIPSNGQENRPVEQVSRPMTLRSLVPELRQESEANADPEAARVLAVLAAEGIPGAHPDSWWGVAPLSSTDPLAAEGEAVNVSPSKVEAVHKSPLNWFIKAAGGEEATDFARSLGTLIHAIAQDLPEAAGHEYLEELARRWPQLGMPDTWESRADFARAQEMVRKMALYVLDMRAHGRSLLAVEADFSVDLPGGSHIARLKGQVDRLELDSHGNLVVIDLKTGRNKPAAKELEQHPQLGAYQAAVNAGAFTGIDGAPAGAVSGGAALAPLGDSTKGMKTQDQAPLQDDDDWALKLVHEAAELMAGAEFEARHDAGASGFGGGCAVPEICPLCTEGKQVTE
ncbi:ATP-dependent helicase [Arthrobacter sp. 35W]|uniref:ATP-dependent helicase n=1 Tax=Arthrobacter sp. 35W TaxID=1132441 RepID=UPI000402508E|nr:ATP-dependent DNA helicase [Arthrobacter sp. 35W]